MTEDKAKQKKADELLNAAFLGPVETTPEMIDFMGIPEDKMFTPEEREEEDKTRMEVLEMQMAAEEEEQAG